VKPPSYGKELRARATAEARPLVTLDYTDHHLPPGGRKGRLTLSVSLPPADARKVWDLMIRLMKEKKF
jgi:hypothetical protein